MRSPPDDIDARQGVSAGGAVAVVQGALVHFQTWPPQLVHEEAPLEDAAVDLAPAVVAAATTSGRPAGSNTGTRPTVTALPLRSALALTPGLS
jgi:hypothetical protein